MPKALAPGEKSTTLTLKLTERDRALLREASKQYAGAR